jgi:succinyl-CoA synthetase beta subunit
MLDELRAARLLDGARGRPAANRQALIQAIDALARLAHGLGDDLTVLEINPLWVAGDTVEALDALAIWR